MIICNVREWRLINVWTNEGGTHSQRSPIQAYITVATIDEAPSKVDEDLSAMLLEKRVDVGMSKMGVATIGG